MARRLHTRVADDIRKACTHDGVLDREQEAEMRAESTEYRNEVMGHYDEDVDPYDDHDEYPEYEPDEDGPIEDEDEHYDAMAEARTAPECTCCPGTGYRDLGCYYHGDHATPMSEEEYLNPDDDDTCDDLHGD